jgi:hypothetical protein
VSDGKCTSIKPKNGFHALAGKGKKKVNIIGTSQLQFDRHTRSHRKRGLAQSCPGEAQGCNQVLVLLDICDFMVGISPHYTC